LTTARYLGDADEKQKADHEDLNKCRPLGPVLPSSDPDLRPIEFEVQLFFPSDAEQVEHTMLAMEAHYTLFVESQRAYYNQIQYRLSPARKGSEGDPKAITMKTELRDNAERLLKFRTRENPSEGVQLASKGEIPLLGVEGQGPWHLVQGTLDFLDGSGKRVARAQIPLFAPEQ
jgi:hypothetical protein